MKELLFSSALIIGIFVIGIVLLTSVESRRSKVTARAMYPHYKNYADSFSIMQGHRELAHSLVVEMVSGEYSSETLKMMGLTDMSDESLEIQSKSLHGLAIDYYEHLKRWEENSLKVVHLCWNNANTILITAKFINKKETLDFLQKMIEDSGHDSFTMTAYPSQGMPTEFEQPNEKESLSWELRMLFEEGNIPRAKNFSG